MIILPIGSDYQRRRVPRLTVTIIVVCAAIYFITFYLSVVTGMIFVMPKSFDLERIERPLMLEYLNTLDPKEAEKISQRMFYSPSARDRFYTEFEQAMRDGKVVPPGSREFQDWVQARAELEQAWRHDPNYMFGYVPADRGLVSLFTHQFLHASFSHVFWNMVFLWLVGANLEDVWGRRYFMVVYLVGGAVAAVSHHAVNPYSYSPMIGASGSIATLMGAFAYRFAGVKLRFVFFKWGLGVWAWIPLSLWFGREFYYAIAYWGRDTGVATWAHLGGFAFGFVAAVFLRRSRAEETFIAAELVEQDQKDRAKAERKAEKQSPGSGRSAALQQGIQFRQTGSLEQAEGCFLEALAQDPDDGEAREELVRLYFQMGRSGDAAREMGELTERLLGRGRRDQALHWYNEICRLELYEAAVGAWTFAMGQELERRGQAEAAQVNYRHFAGAAPDDPRAPKALFLAGVISRDKLSRAEEAAELFAALRQRYPDWMSAEVEQALDLARRQAGR